MGLGRHVTALERTPVATGAVDGATVETLILEAVAAHRNELEALRFLPERRYDRATFPTIGQYDWLAGQVLYCLVRATRPRVLVEFSTSSGYSTTFSALAVRKNGGGLIHSVDLDGNALEAARRWLTRQGVSDFVQLHQGDCRKVVPTLLSDDVDLLFIDSLHSFDMALWYLRHVVPRLRPDCLVHIHDVMPPEARVRIHGGPPYATPARAPRPPVLHLLKRFVWLLLHGRWPNPMPARPPREALPLHRLAIVPPTQDGDLPTIDGNYFEEAVIIRELLRDARSDEAVYLHRLEPLVAVGDSQRYAHLDQIGRSDARGRLLEWNDALWCRARTLQHAVGRHDRPQVR
jgi:predicted O-methyltransferase YrrM